MDYFKGIATSQFRSGHPPLPVRAKPEFRAYRTGDLIVNKRVFDLVMRNRTSQSLFRTRSSTACCAPVRPVSGATPHASSRHAPSRLPQWLDGAFAVLALFPLWRFARRGNSLASRLPGTTRLVLRTSLAGSEGTGIEVVKIPPRSPNLNPVCERFLGSVRRECLDHVVILSEQQLRRVLNEYVEIYFNRARPHQGLRQAIPAAAAQTVPTAGGKVVRIPLLGGLHHNYQWAA